LSLLSARRVSELTGLGVGDLVVQQRVQLGGLGAGVAEAPADGLDGHA